MQNKKQLTFAKLSTKYANFIEYTVDREIRNVFHALSTKRIVHVPHFVRTVAVNRKLYPHENPNVYVLLHTRLGVDELKRLNKLIKGACGRPYNTSSKL